jgi:hypothetical protein
MRELVLLLASVVFSKANGIQVFSSGTENLKPDYRKGLQVRDPPDEMVLLAIIDLYESKLII